MDEIEFLRFKDWQETISRNRLSDAWLVVCCFKEEEKASYTMFCALMPNKKDLIKRVLTSPYWEISFDYGHPEFWREGAKGVIHYERFGVPHNEIPFEPLVLYRDFYGLREYSVELSEEFRLYHNLYHDTTHDKFTFIDKTGEEEVTAKIEKINNDFTVCVKTKYLRDFLAAKKMVLIRFHDHTRYSDRDMTEHLRKDIIIQRKSGRDFCYEIIINPNAESILEWKASSRFVAKDMLPPLSQPNNPSYQFLAGMNTKKYESFIVSTDSDGNSIKRTCNPSALLPGEYLTPVFFKREVLKKYYDNPHKYTVGDNYISCGTLWVMRYGQNVSGFVHAWKQYNVPPEGGLGLATIKRELYI
ncbi:MAG: hypothetical protein ACPLZC_07225 [Candidatus Bathyarchaeales archaeon]